MFTQLYTRMDAVSHFWEESSLIKLLRRMKQMYTCWVEAKSSQKMKNMAIITMFTIGPDTLRRRNNNARRSFVVEIQVGFLRK